MGVTVLQELRQGPPAELLGGGVERGSDGPHDYLRPSPLLPSKAQAALSRSPDLLMPRSFQSCLCARTWAHLSPSGPAMGVVPYLKNGPHHEGAHLTAASSGSPAQGATPAPVFPH